MYVNITFKVFEYLHKAGYIDDKTFNEKSGEAEGSTESSDFFHGLVRRKLIEEKRLVEAFSKYFKIPLAAMNQIETSPEMAALIPESYAVTHSLVPIHMSPDESVTVAISDPFDTRGQDAVRFITGRQVFFQLATASEIKTASEFLYNPDNYIQNLTKRTSLKGSSIEYENFDRGKVIESVSEGKSSLAPIVKLLNVIITDAFAHRASDIHIEPYDNRLLVRYRIDGELVEKMEFPEFIGPPLISRVKVLSELDLANRFSPQDGKIHVRINRQPLDLRISILPTIWGEKAVIRLLDGRMMFSSLENLGFSGQTLKNFRDMIIRPQGIILVTGPTGSGKSTTLYGAIAYLRSEFKTLNITTIEDPVEYEIEGVNQVQVNPRRGITFASSLRSILRQDPDVILVGEIRDAETADIAVQAAQTGHLVFSTLHTNDSIGAVSRLKELGMDISMIREVTLGILAQRLVKKICPFCKREAPFDQLPPELVNLARSVDPDINFSYGQGCQQCDWTGFLGRTVVMELLAFDEVVKDAIEDEHTLRTLTAEAGMKTLALSALELVASGVVELKSTARSVDLYSMPPKSKKRVIEGIESLVEPMKNKKSNSFATLPRILMGGLSDEFASRVEIALQELNPEVNFAKSAEEILRNLHLKKPDLLIIDEFSSTDAETLLEEIRSHLCFVDLPLLLITDRPPQLRDEVPFCIGADDYILPPLDPKRIREVVFALLERNK